MPKREGPWSKDESRIKKHAGKIIGGVLGITAGLGLLRGNETTEHTQKSSVASKKIDRESKENKPPADVLLPTSRPSQKSSNENKKPANESSDKKGNTLDTEDTQQTKDTFTKQLAEIGGRLEQKFSNLKIHGDWIGALNNKGEHETGEAFALLDEKGVENPFKFRILIHVRPEAEGNFDFFVKLNLGPQGNAKAVSFELGGSNEKDLNNILYLLYSDECRKNMKAVIDETMSVEDLKAYFKKNGYDLGN